MFELLEQFGVLQGCFGFFLRLSVNQEIHGSAEQVGDFTQDISRGLYAFVFVTVDLGFRDANSLAQLNLGISEAFS